MDKFPERKAGRRSKWEHKRNAVISMALNPDFTWTDIERATGVPRRTVKRMVEESSTNGQVKDE